MRPPLITRFAPAASRDITEILDDAEYPVPADWETELALLVEQLAMFPAMGRAWPELRPGIRSFVLGSFLVFYRFDATTVEIVRVLHGSRDIEAIFRKN